MVAPLYWQVAGDLKKHFLSVLTEQHNKAEYIREDSDDTAK